MAVRQKDYNASNGLALLKLALQEKDANENVPGRVPSSIAENAYFSSMPNTNEQEREAQGMDASANRAEQRLNGQTQFALDEQGAKAEASTYGFENPRAQMEDTAQKKLQQILIPEQVKLKAAESGADEARSYVQIEHEKDRASRSADIAAAQGGQNQRQQVTIGQQNAMAAAKYKQQHPIMNFFGVGRPAAAAPQDASQTVEMTTPDGRTMDVPPDRVAEMESHGAVRK